jgi:hypothetical protein
MVLNFKEECRFVGLTKMCKLFTLFFNFSLVILYILIEIILFATDDHEKISHTGHFCGLLSGFVVGFIVLDNRKKDPWETIVGKVFIILYAIVFLGMMLMHMTKNEYLDYYCFDCKKAFHNIIDSTRNSSECNEWKNCGNSTSISAECPDPCLEKPSPRHCPSYKSEWEI